MAAQTSDPEEISKTADGLTQLRLMPVLARHYYYCFRKCTASVSVCVTTHIN